MKITQALQDGQEGRTFSFEFFPPKTEIGLQNLHVRLERMAKLKPTFVTVTWGAGGSTSSKSLDLALHCQKHLELTVCLHLTCTNMEKSIIDNALRKAKEAGIQNILALRGDPPRGHEYFENPSSDFVYAVDLVRYIREEYGNFFCIGVAAYPEGHAYGSIPEQQNFQLDMPYLVEKVEAGADFIVTQLFYNVDAFATFEKALRDHPSGLFKRIPIFPGLMPINSYASIRKTAKMSHALLPSSILDRLESVRGDDECVKIAGVDITSNIITRIAELTEGRITHFHFYTLNLEKSATLILERTKLLYAALAKDGAKTDTAVNGRPTIPNVSNGVNGVKRRGSSVISDPHNRVIVEEIKQGMSRMDLLRSAKDVSMGYVSDEEDFQNNIAIAEGEGSLGREATWDDFPNGRFGDARSPAYGQIDGYGVSLHVSPSQALHLWGSPQTCQDISDLFVKHINGELAVLPWYEEGLNPESRVIIDQLTYLNSHCLWTVASQPSVNAASSMDRTFGWGPARGFVFQKAFVEFFIEKSLWQSLREKLSSNAEVTFYAGSLEGHIESNAESGELNTVTWGVFPGKEIVSPTIIERVSFTAWRVR